MDTCILLMTALALPIWSVEARPVPSMGDMAAARALITEVFKEDLAKTRPDERKALAGRMLEQAQDSSNGAVTIYALLISGGRLAAQVEATDLVVASIRTICAAYGPAGIPKELLGEATMSARKPEQAKPLAEEFLSIAIRAMEQESWEIAARCACAAADLARKARSATLADRAGISQVRIQHLMRAAKGIDAARTALEANPDDPAANLAVGRYTCFVKGGWKEGLPMLSRGTDADLRMASLQDMALQETILSDATIKMGDTWFELGEKETAFLSKVGLPMSVRVSGTRNRPPD